MAKEWIGKIRVYLKLNQNYYAFFWLSMWQDGSLSCGFMPKMQRTEYGTTITHDGNFTNHQKAITKGNVDIKKASFLHVSFHPPRLSQKTGVAHIKDRAGYVDKWDVDWFPVKRPTHLFTVDTGNITILEKAVIFKKPYEVVVVPSNIKYLRMNLFIYPRTAVRFHDPNSITKLIGICPNFIVCCYFYQRELCIPAFYVAGEV